MSKAKYCVVLLEDSEPDVFLLRRHLNKMIDDVDIRVTSTQADYERAVRTLDPDLILADYRLPRYSGIEALMYARAHAPVVPFIFVTGALNDEELAADTILKGASGFVLKNNLDKLAKIIPPLLDRKQPLAEPAAIETTVLESDAMTDAIDGDLMSHLSTADAATLAEIRRLLTGRKVDEVQTSPGRAFQDRS